MAQKREKHAQGYSDYEHRKQSYHIDKRCTFTGSISCIQVSGLFRVNLQHTVLLEDRETLLHAAVRYA
jgi:hypothetical protein